MDYKIFFAIPLILFAVTGFKNVIERNLSWKEFAFRIGFIISWFSITIIYLFVAPRELSPVYYRVLDNQTILSVIIFSLTILATIYCVKINHNKLKSKKVFNVSLVSIIIFIGLISFDGFRVISDMNTLKQEASDGWFAKYNIPIEKDGKLIAYTIFENLPNERPERETPDFFVWRGIVNGSFTTQDFSKTKLVSKDIIYSDPYYFQYMEMKWTPIFFDPFNFKNNKVKLDEKTLSEIITNPQTSVIQTHYGINDIHYKVSLKESTIMLENEMYFPGWTATLFYPDKEIKLEAIEVNGAFRAWALPAGNYEMKANFQFPNYTTYQIISLTAFVIWISVLISYFIKSRSIPTKTLE